MVTQKRTLEVSLNEKSRDNELPIPTQKNFLAQILDERLSCGEIIEKREALPNGKERLTLRGCLP